MKISIDKISSFNKEKLEFLSNKNNKIFDFRDLNLVHHVWRVVIQLGIDFRIKEVCSYIIKLQDENGEWGNRDFHHNYGDTIVNIHRLLWSLVVLDKDLNNKDFCNQIITSVKKSINYILDNHDIHYNINRTFGHGMIDRLHYLMQVEFYLIKLNDNYNLLTEEQYEITEKYYSSDNQWMINNQKEDGGFDEVDRLRTRIGTTSDAVRAINLDNSFIKTVKKSIDFIMINQNKYDGYWDSGNIDKNSDALKALLNSKQLFKGEYAGKIEQSVNNGIAWLLDNFNTSETLSENEYDLLTITIDYEKVILNKQILEFL